LKRLVLIVVLAVVAATTGGIARAEAKSTGQACVNPPRVADSYGVYMMPNPHLYPLCGYWTHGRGPDMYKRVVTCPAKTAPVNIFVDSAGAVLYACAAKDSEYAHEYADATSDDWLLGGNSVADYFRVTWTFPDRRAVRNYISARQWRVMAIISR